MTVEKRERVDVLQREIATGMNLLDDYDRRGNVLVDRVMDLLQRIVMLNEIQGPGDSPQRDRLGDQIVATRRELAVELTGFEATVEAILAATAEAEELTGLDLGEMREAMAETRAAVRANMLMTGAGLERWGL